MDVPNATYVTTVGVIVISGGHVSPGRSQMRIKFGSKMPPGLPSEIVND